MLIHKDVYEAFWVREKTSSGSEEKVQLHFLKVLRIMWHSYI